MNWRFFNIFLHILRRNESGVAALEFALILPFLLAMFLGMFEVSRYILIHQKVEKTSHTIADIVAQATTMTTTELDNILSSTTNLMSPYSFGSSGLVIVTSVSKTGTNPPRVMWQRSGGGSLVASSYIGAVSATATLPAGFTMNDKDNIIIAEVYYNFSPIIVQDILGNNQIYKTATFKPRLGSLSTLN